MDDLILGSLKPYQIRNIERMRAEMKAQKSAKEAHLNAGNSNFMVPQPAIPVVQDPIIDAKIKEKQD